MGFWWDMFCFLDFFLQVVFLIVRVKTRHRCEVNGGTTEAKVDFVMGLFEQEVKIADCFSQDEMIDVIGATKGKGFNGVVAYFNGLVIAGKGHVKRCSKGVSLLLLHHSFEPV